MSYEIGFRHGVLGYTRGPGDDEYERGFNDGRGEIALNTVLGLDRSPHVLWASKLPTDVWCANYKEVHDV